MPFEPIKRLFPNDLDQTGQISTTGPRYCVAGWGAMFFGTQSDKFKTYIISLFHRIKDRYDHVSQWGDKASPEEVCKVVNEVLEEMGEIPKEAQ